LHLPVSLALRLWSSLTWNGLDETGSRSQ